jgi:hypothetical protein
VRIVAVADTHLFTERLEVPVGDVFVHAGDLGRRGDLDELARAAAWIAALPHRHLVVAAGNPQWAFPREPAAARALLGPVIYLEDSGAAIDGLRFWGSPWQPAFNGWAFYLARGAPLREVWARIPAGLDVLITHGPPLGFGDDSGWEGEERAGCADLRARVAEVPPRLHLFGHIHQAGGCWREGPTTFANVTTWECARAPTVIDLDSDGVKPISVPPPDRIY